MNFWIDAQLPPSLAIWMTETFGVSATSLRDLGLRDAGDTEIFNAARTYGVVVVSKDSDFVDLVTRLGTPPQILLWSQKQSNTSNREYRQCSPRLLHCRKC